MSFFPLNFCRINFWVHSVIIKLLPCCILTIISFVLIDVLCRANKRKLKLKGYNKAGTNGHRWGSLNVETLLIQRSFLSRNWANSLSEHFEMKWTMRSDFFFSMMGHGIIALTVEPLSTSTLQIIENWPSNGSYNDAARGRAIVVPHHWISTRNFRFVERHFGQMVSK